MKGIRISAMFGRFMWLCMKESLSLSQFHILAQTLKQSTANIVGILVAP